MSIVLITSFKIYFIYFFVIYQAVTKKSAPTCLTSSIDTLDAKTSLQTGKV